MKKLICLIVVLQSIQFLFAQQRPQYTQYVLNNYIINPALSGIENYTDVKISSRDQWVGLNGAPRTMYLTVHSPIGKKTTKLPQHHLWYQGKTQEAKVIGKITQLPNHTTGWALVL